MTTKTIKGKPGQAKPVSAAPYKKHRRIKPIRRKPSQAKPAVRRPVIPDDLSYLTDTEFGQTMLRLVEEIAKEQGTRTTKEINRLMDLMRGGVSTHVDLP